MSQTAVALVAALVGSVVTLLATFLRGLQDRFSARVGTMEVVRGEIDSALERIAAALRSGQLWPSGCSLRSNAWEANHANLAVHLKTATVRDLHRRIKRLEVAEELADAVRDKSKTADKDEAKAEAEKFTAWLRDLEPELSKAIVILDEANDYARSRFRRGLTLAGALFAGLAIACVLVVSSGPSVTGGSVANDLRAHVPGATKTVCEKSANWEGTFRCAVEIPACHGQLEASTGGPQCGKTETKVLNVDSSGACDYLYEVAGPPRGGGSVKQQNGWLKTASDWICKKR